MIFVTVGTRTEGFDRLVEWVDEITADLDEDVIIQVGHTSTKPEHAEWFEFTDIDEINTLTEEADMVVGHGGAGTILKTLEAGTPIVCVPRLEKYDEIYDDHQFELTNKLAENGTIAVANSKSELREILLSSHKESTMNISNDLTPYFRDHLAMLEEELL